MPAEVGDAEDAVQKEPKQEEPGAVLVSIPSSRNDSDVADADVEHDADDVPKRSNVKRSVAALIYRITLAILLLGFLTLPLATAYWMVSAFARPLTFYNHALLPGVIVCGFASLGHQAAIFGSGLVQVLQLRTHTFVYKSYLIFNCSLVSYFCHLLAYVPLAAVLWRTLDDTMADTMRDSLKDWNNKNKSQQELDARWVRTHQAYDCCGFGGHWMYKRGVPDSCCAQPPCTIDNTTGINCYTADAEIGTSTLTFGIHILWVPLPIIVLLFFGFYCFRPYWTLPARESWTSIGTFSAGKLSSEDDDDEHSDFKYIKTKSHLGTSTTPPEVNWRRSRWRQLSKQAVSNESFKIKMDLIKEEKKENKERFEQKVANYRKLREKRDEQLGSPKSPARSKELIKKPSKN